MNIAPALDIPPSTLQGRLRDAREWREFQQAEVALALEVSRQTISNWERGFTTPSKADIDALAGFYQVNPVWLRSGLAVVPPHPGGSSLRGLRTIVEPESAIFALQERRSGMSATAPAAEPIAA